MTKKRRKPTHTDAARERQLRERDEARERPRERFWRIGAAQMAAPSTRRWRRAGRFGSTDER